jgi:hypothetical protein
LRKTISALFRSRNENKQKRSDKDVQEATRAVIVSRLCAGWNLKTSKRAQKDDFKRSVWRMLGFWRACYCVNEDKKIAHEEHRLHMGCPLAANPEEFITRDPSMSMRAQWHKMNISRITVRKADLRYKLYSMRRGPFYQRQAKGCRNGSRRTSRRCGRWRSSLPAHLTTVFLTILSGASLGYWSMQSLTTKSRA